ncbi:Na(+)-translocating NADH-quinone reductase subunit A [hydrothermal vent metagenome]|uniref:Na(+)-translocating NADH-quinone reductase subunit A n=1 Tax=hydrothermal vent metagenome TaxID=652676 RepID=A0A3B1A9F5_9ZZZZ
MRITIKKGLDIPLPGKPEQFIYPAQDVTTVALLGADFTGLKAKLLVSPGDRVGLGQPLFHDKHDPLVKYTAPASGTIAAINRGARRVLQSVVIALDEGVGEDRHFPIFNGEALAELGEHTVRDVLLSSGLWTALRTRPYNRVPHSASHPRALFVTAIDTQPLAANPQVIIDCHRKAFRQGLRVIARLTTGPVYLCTGVDGQIDDPMIDCLQVVAFSGPHPAGLPGTHINHLFPVSAEKSVWHIGYQDVIAIGKLFTSGHIWSERVVALGGTSVIRPRLLRTRLGASIDDLVRGEIAGHTPCRIISGSVLSGHIATEVQAYLGHYHRQVSVIHENKKRRRLFGWFRAPSGNESFTTALHGRPTAMIPVGDFERVMPLDILPAPLLRALLVRDTDLAQDLGCLDLAEEDLALCSYVCPAKYDYGSVLRINLDQIEREG